MPKGSLVIAEWLLIIDRVANQCRHSRGCGCWQNGFAVAEGHASDATASPAVAVTPSAEVAATSSPEVAASYICRGYGWMHDRGR